MTKDSFERWLLATDREPLVMGVLNVTPDSFSDGGRFAAVEAAVSHARQMIAEGADLIDVGGESTRPGSEPTSEEDQIGRIGPVIRQIVAGGDAVISVDTTRARVAEAALNAGAAVVNDVSAGRDDPAMLSTVADRGVPIILMHMQGTPATMQHNPTYSDVVGEVRDFLADRCDAADQAGVAEHRVLVDPGIGFGKTDAHNLELLRRLSTLVGAGRPVVVGTSRKGFVGRVTGESDPSRRVYGTAATVAWSVAYGASMVRVHDVSAMAQVTRMVRAILRGE